MRKWTKGIVFVNGRNLGRYWSIGPQLTLYLPGPWLNVGSNSIVVFEEIETPIDQELVFTTEHLINNEK